MYWITVKWKALQSFTHKFYNRMHIMFSNFEICSIFFWYLLTGISSFTVVFKHLANFTWRIHCAFIACSRFSISGDDHWYVTSWIQESYQIMLVMHCLHWPRAWNRLVHSLKVCSLVTRNFPQTSFQALCFGTHGG